MIIFDLDGTLADCEHRRHLVDRNHPINEKKRLPEISLIATCDPDPNQYVWKPDWKSFYESCDKDIPIEPTCHVFRQMILTWPEDYTPIQIWSGRCESVRDKTVKWIKNWIQACFNDSKLKMRPIGDNTPDDQLKERWLDARCDDLYSPDLIEKNYANKHDIEMVFTSDPATVKMFRRRGIFVFNCCQHDKEV
jgi:hypothetical protein